MINITPKIQIFGRPAHIRDLNAGLVLEAVAYVRE